MKIINHRLFKDDDKPYPFRESPNVGGNVQHNFLVMHYTAGPNAEQAINWLSNTRAKASAHVVIGRDGSITQLVPFNKVAWHAGRSEWRGLSNLNGYSLGIELDNAGTLTRDESKKWRAWFGEIIPDDQVLEAIHKDETSLRGWHLYTSEQLYAALELSCLLVEQYKLKEVVGHDDIAPRRKTDPGPAFPMESFRSRIYGRKDKEDNDGSPGSSATYETTTELNVRTGPGPEFKALAISPVPMNTRVLVLTEKGQWKQVQLLDTVRGVAKAEGWVHGRYLRIK
jgi:N-acetylmuramoyl-L-alanine amidase